MTVYGNGNREAGALMAFQLQLSADAVTQLKEGIDLLLLRWSALQIAVHNEWGGHNSARKSELFSSVIFSWFTQSKEPLYIDDLEDMLDENMVSLFKTEIEDGSTEEVAEKLMVMHEECLEGNYKSIEKLREANSRGVVSHVRQVVDKGSVGKDDLSNMIVDAPQKRSSSSTDDMQVDEGMPEQVAEAEEGWVVVSSRRSRGKRH
ncbi:pre-rRNA-processing protein TSR2-like [Malania oleifera]|uniref:pre-rRNA-processing protein TSR2-like n=1 Tax=Malania oleifera TaxID=397392 RepID=UPI0025ADF350|nr:pre-rRNA-processing protein TSR2-like [Malania oleifera]XP_057961087.1 pre-rRNA-processing protein TSR2-like [Malania oleifera]